MRVVPRGKGGLGRLSQLAPQKHFSTHHAWRHPDCISDIVWMLHNSQRHTIMLGTAHYAALGSTMFGIYKLVECLG